MITVSEVWVVQERWDDDLDYSLSNVCATVESAKQIAAEELTQPGHPTVELDWKHYEFDYFTMYKAHYSGDERDDSIEVMISNWDVIE